MSQTDFWYIRFPDGRVLRASTTAVLRQELNAGHIPLSSTIRRSPHEEWVALQWSQEFAELVEELAARKPEPPQPRKRRSVEPRSETPAPVDNTATAGSRLESSRLHFVGVRGYLDELLAALDSALTVKKLLLGGFAGLLFGALFALQRVAWFELDNHLRAVAWTLLAVGVVVFDGLTALLTRLTYLELARLRPARWREGLDGLGRLTVWVVASQLIVCGAAWGMIVLLRWLPFWLGPSAEDEWSRSQQIFGGLSLTIGMVLETLLWSLFLLWWLLPPLLVVEDCTVWRGLRQWLNLLRQHFGRVFLCQMAALGLSALIAVPFFLLIAPLFLPSFSTPDELGTVVGTMRPLLFGLACGAMLTYWITSNVFIYLNLRYGANGRR